MSCYCHGYKAFICVLCFFHTFYLRVGGVTNGSQTENLTQMHVQELFRKYSTDGFVNEKNLGLLLSNIRRKNKQCFFAKDVIGQPVNISEFHAVMLTMLYALDSHCPDKVHEDHSHELLARNDWKVWSASIGAVLVISVSGLLVVALVPVMSRRIYNVVTQFLIALSVGSLIGDAFLHLIPHALLSHSATEESHGHSHGSDDMAEHDAFVWKSLIVLLGIYGFFITERVTILCQNQASKRKMKRSGAITGDLPFINPLSQVGKGKNADIHSGSSSPSRGNPGSILTSPKIDSPASPNQLNGHVDQLPVSPSTAREGKNDPVECQLVVNYAAGCHISSVPDGPDCGTDLGMSKLTGSDRQLCNHPPSRLPNNARCVDFPSSRNCNEAEVTPTSLIVGGCQDRDNCNSSLPVMQTNRNGFLAPSWNLKEVISSVHEASEVITEVAQQVNQKAVQHSPGGDKSGTHDAKVIHHNGHGHNHHHNGHGHSHHHHHFPRAFPHRKKPHGHHHGHSHDLSSVRAIAYTIIAGDGLHNFCDGIAIGASFAESMQGGLSTALAVLCHELPHELGDFAVLLHAGMSVKAALFYNTLSSILCSAGMILGVLLGSLPSVNAWLFLLTAGMFVYIALVDMMPELATNRLSGYKRCHLPSVLFLWQNMGMLIGIGIMFVIARLEGSLS